ncbi:MAG: CinA family nicotinamide mononucleotide deamidase-related protein [Candidatus Marinimicrobia bacterium]|nr:CinA family nicotinamide mononucleotide deamidase-related protein [Candidatus Neomarinimicrobiota bacterium]
MNAEIINIGDELLAGHTLNSNASWMSAKLRGIAIPVTRHTVVPDEKNAIIHTLNAVLESSTHIFITGGLGPTGDDRTKAIITEYFGGKLVFMQNIYDEINAFFQSQGRIPSPNNKEQAWQPDNAELISNTRGTAHGMIFHKAKQIFYVMPGVPFEMQAMMTDVILPRLADISDSKDIEMQINTFGVPESEIADVIAKHFPEVEKEIILGYYPSVRGITIRLRGKKRRVIEEYHTKIATLLGTAVFSLQGESLAFCIVDMCRKRNLNLATAESCTGGLIASNITDIPGASHMFKQGYIVYSNEAKTNLLGVTPSLIENHGAVSRETVEAMARGAQTSAGTDIAVAVSGIAGPDGGTAEKPVGTVWIALIYKNKLYTQKLSRNRGRRKNKEYAANSALNMIRLILQENK